MKRLGDLEEEALLLERRHSDGGLTSRVRGADVDQNAEKNALCFR